MTENIVSVEDVLNDITQVKITNVLDMGWFMFILITLSMVLTNYKYKSI